MNEDPLRDLLKAHYGNRRLTDERVEAIMETCQIARGAHRWRQRAIGAAVLASVAVSALGVSMLSRPARDERLGGASRYLGLVREDDANRQKLVAIMIHANDCPNSRAMEPVFADLQEEFLDEPVLFIKFDYSSKCALHQAELLSRNLGLEGVFHEYRKTGAIVLASPTGVVRDVVAPLASMDTAAATVRNTLAVSHSF